VNINIKVITTSASVFTKESLLIGFIDSLLKTVGLMPELSSYINIGSLGLHTKTNDQSSFDKLMRIMSQDFSVLASTRLRLIRIDNQIRGSIFEYY
jgi:hypothetical protein